MLRFHGFQSFKSIFGLTTGDVAPILENSVTNVTDCCEVNKFLYFG